MEWLMWHGLTCILKSKTGKITYMKWILRNPQKRETYGITQIILKHLSISLSKKEEEA
ncbi:MAG: hypothetical protein ACTS80_01035 [Candidatus Hodgkinia cicadicola]